MKIAAISGSLRGSSSNAALLRAAAELAPTGVEVLIEEDLGKLPHFNPDLDGEGAQPPKAVATFRQLLSNAQAVIICTPEYAHGVPGVLKNALDWIVSSGELRGKPVALMVASPSGGEFARASLIPTLDVLEARVIGDASITIRQARKAIDHEGKLLDAQLAEELKKRLALLVEAAEREPPTSETSEHLSYVMHYLEDFAIGQKYGSGKLRVNAPDIKAFAQKFDPQPFHLDEAAARESFFKGLASSGWHTAAMTMRLLVESPLRPAGGIIGGWADELKWPRPVWPGDELELESEVLEVRPSRSQPERGFIKVRTTTFNQRREPVQVVVMNLLVQTRGSQPKS